MKKLLVLVIILIQSVSCDRYPDPTIETLTNYSFYFMNSQGQRFFEGEWVNDSVTLLGNDYANPYQEPIRVLFEVVSGGGTITTPEALIGINGFATTRWKLGSYSTEQVLRAKTYNMSGKYLSSTDFKAYGFREGEWNKWYGTPDGRMTSLVADTVNGITYMVSDGVVYRQGGRYYQWEALTDPLLQSAWAVKIDSKGVIYLSTGTGSLVRSLDHGLTWYISTKPFPERPYYFFLSIANDNTLWAYDNEHLMKFSDDGGSTWTEAGEEISSIGAVDVFRLTDGSLLIHGSNSSSLHISHDNGQSWTPVSTPGYSLKLFVNEHDEIFIVTQESGISIYRSTDQGVTFSRVHQVVPDFVTAMDNTFTKRGAYYYVLIPGYGILRSSDLENYEDYYINKNLMNLFIDNNGVLIAKDQDYNTVYYKSGQLDK